MVFETTKTAAQRRREWARDRASAANRLGITEEQATEILDALPYSTIPGWVDVVHVVLAVRELQPHPNGDGPRVQTTKEDA